MSVADGIEQKLLLQNFVDFKLLGEVAAAAEAKGKQLAKRRLHTKGGKSRRE